MITLITICDLFWLLWLLPLLLGMLLTWLYWKNKYSNMVTEYNGKIKGLNGRISSLEVDLAECGAKRSELEGDLAITKGRMREIEADMKTLKATVESDKKSGKGSSSSNISALSSDSASVGKDKPADNSSSNTNNVKGDLADKNIDLANVSSSLAGSSAAAGITNTDTGNAVNTSSTPANSGKKSIYGGLKSDNLQIIEGIGPKMESVLKENGVNNHSDLSDQSPESLRAILGKYGDKYKIIDPTTWSQQAGFAASNDWDGMIDLQKKLVAGKENASGMTDSKLEKYLIKTGALKAFKQDDLKAMEGIGPATEKLLHSNGIKTWRELANTEASAIKAILTAAGSRFALGDPTTWPKQAEMAADGKFDELREYQDFLDGGKE